MYRSVYIQRHQKCTVLFTYRHKMNSLVYVQRHQKYTVLFTYRDTNNVPFCLHRDTPTMYRPVYIHRHQQCAVLFTYRDTNNMPSCLDTYTPTMYRPVYIQTPTICRPVYIQTPTMYRPVYIQRHQQCAVLFTYIDTNNVPSCLHTETPTMCRHVYIHRHQQGTVQHNTYLLFNFKCSCMFHLTLSHPTLCTHIYNKVVNITYAHISQDKRQFTCNIILRRVRAPCVAVEGQCVLHNLSVCL